LYSVVENWKLIRLPDSACRVIEDGLKRQERTDRIKRRLIEIVETILRRHRLARRALVGPKLMQLALRLAECGSWPRPALCRSSGHSAGPPTGAKLPGIAAAPARAAASSTGTGAANEMSRRVLVCLAGDARGTNVAVMRTAPGSARGHSIGQGSRHYERAMRNRIKIQYTYVQRKTGRMTPLCYHYE
jgi:hypothetical protein